MMTDNHNLKRKNKHNEKLWTDTCNNSSTVYNVWALNFDWVEWLQSATISSKQSQDRNTGVLGVCTRGGLGREFFVTTPSVI